LARLFGVPAVTLDAVHPRPPVVMLEPIREDGPPSARKPAPPDAEVAPAETWKRLRAEAAARDQGNGKRTKAAN
jgi:hypothetical protein